MKVSPKSEKSGRGKYCSKKCYNAGRKCSLVDKKCSNCLRVFKVPKWKEYVGKKWWFCNKNCYGQFIKNHPEFHRQYRPEKLTNHPVLTKELLWKEYVVNGMKMTDIAIKYGYGYVSINSWIKRYGIPTRTQADYLPKTTIAAIGRLIREKRGDRCELCAWDKARCDVHHKIAQRDGGLHTEDNLIVLCPNCHRLVETNKLKI